MALQPLPPATVDEQAPYQDLTGQVVKINDHYFAYGGFSDVYIGEWTDAAGVVHKVAIKVLRGVHHDSQYLETTRRRINRESHLWHSLDHPNILPFLGVARELGPCPALISPLCEFGGALEYLQAHPEVSRLNIAHGTGEGLEYLHSLDVVHGDLKISNVLIDNNGTPRLCDFGRSKIIGHRGYTTMFTGVARYMAPEMVGGQSEEEAPVDEPPKLTKETDVYAFGMLALEILSGRPPYYYLKHDTQVIHQVLTGHQPDPGRYQQYSIANGTWNTLKECWAFNPEDRPTAAVVVQRLV